MDYHIWECERCHHTTKSTEQPQYWTRMTTLTAGTGRNNFSEKKHDLCCDCFSLVQRFIGNKSMELIDTELYERTPLAEEKTIAESAPSLVAQG